ncbi:hypothetical protein ACOME3_010237 [Neoechinorhynchus agilis]
MDDFLSIIRNKQTRDSLSLITSNRNSGESSSAQRSSLGKEPRKHRCCRKAWLDEGLKTFSVAFRKLRDHLSRSKKPTVTNEPDDHKESVVDQFRRRNTSRKLPKPEHAREWEESIDKLLSSSYGVELFHSFLKTEFSEETLEFWLACEDFKCANKSERKGIAHNICSTFVKVGAPKQVNLDSETRNATMNQLEKLDLNMFDAAQSRVQHLMDQGPYQRFLESEMCLNLTRQSKS